VEYFRENRKTVFSIVVVIILAGLYTFSVIHKRQSLEAMDNPAMNALSTAAEQTPYIDMEGNVLDFDSYLGEVIIVNSWASWSPDSVNELPMLARVANEFSDKNVKVIAINRSEPKTTAERFLQTIGAADGVELVLDADDRYYKSVVGYAMPETIFYDRAGNIVHHEHGVLTEDKVRQYLEDALNSPAE
jgi:thiol-disulfide isomerase/thioredoxin